MGQTSVKSLEKKRFKLLFVPTATRGLHNPMQLCRASLQLIVLRNFIELVRKAIAYFNHGLSPSVKIFSGEKGKLPNSASTTGIFFVFDLPLVANL